MMSKSILQAIADETLSEIRKQLENEIRPLDWFLTRWEQGPAYFDSGKNITLTVLIPGPEGKREAIRTWKDIPNEDLLSGGVTGNIVSSIIEDVLNVQARTIRWAITETVAPVMIFNPRAVQRMNGLA